MPAQADRAQQPPSRVQLHTVEGLRHHRPANAAPLLSEGAYGWLSPFCADAMRSVAAPRCCMVSSGVAENCFFMKEISDTVSLRKKIQESFELAALPRTSEAERRKVLHFVVVGGGPTGVEFAGTLNDFVTEDLSKNYPE